MLLDSNYMTFGKDKKLYKDKKTISSWQGLRSWWGEQEQTGRIGRFLPQ